MSRESLRPVFRVALCVYLIACASPSTDNPPGLVGEREPATVSELELSVRSAVEAVVGARAIEVTETIILASGRRVIRWVDYRSHRDYAEIEAAELVEGQQSPVRISGKIVLGSGLYMADSIGGDDAARWTFFDRQGDPAILSDNPLMGEAQVIPLTQLGPEGSLETVPEGYYDALIGSPDVVVETQSTDDGGSMWYLGFAVDSEGTRLEMSYGIHPEGHLRSYTVERRDPPSAGNTSSIEPDIEPSRSVSVHLVDNPKPIRQPDSGSVFTVEVFDLPEEFPTN